MTNTKHRSVNRSLGLLIACICYAFPMLKYALESFLNMKLWVVIFLHTLNVISYRLLTISTTICSSSYKPMFWGRNLQRGNLICYCSPNTGELLMSQSDLEPSLSYDLCVLRRRQNVICQASCHMTRGGLPIGPKLWAVRKWRENWQVRGTTDMDRHSPLQHFTITTQHEQQLDQD